MTEPNLNIFLAKYIESYDVFLTAANNLSYLLFGACVFLFSRKLGVVSKDTSGYARQDFLLFAVLLGCILTIVSNFLLQGQIAVFFSDSYLRSLSNDEGFRFCLYRDNELPIDCFQRLRQDRIRHFAVTSSLAVAFSGLLFVIWLVLTLCKRRSP